MIVERLARLVGGRIMFFALAYAGGAAVQKGLGFVLFMWFAGTLSVDDYARFGLLYALQTGVAALALAGIIETTIGGLKNAGDDAGQRALLRSANVVFLVTAGLAVFAVPTAFSWSGTYGWPAIVGAAVSGALTAFFILQAQLARIVERHGVALLLGFLPGLIGLLGGLGGFLTEPSPRAFFVGSTCGLVASLPLVAFARLGFADSFLRDVGARRILLTMGPFVLVALVDWFLGYGSTYLTKAFFANEVVARFVFAYTLSSIMHLVATSLNQAWSPRVYRMIHSQPLATVERGNRRFHALQGLILGTVGAALLIAVPIAVAMIPSMAAYRNLHIESLILFAIYACVIPWYHAQNYYYAHEQGPVLMRISIVTSLTGVALWIAAASVLGPIGAYVGLLLMTLAKVTGGVFWARRTWGIWILWQGPVIALMLLLLGTWASVALTPFAVETLLDNFGRSP